MIFIRSATAADSDKIRALVRAARINPTSLDWKRFIVAQTFDGETIGCGQLKPHREGYLELASIVVAPIWRKRGVATAMINHMLEKNPGQIYLMCRSGLGPFYERFGFEGVQQADMPRYFRRISRLAGLAELLMREGEQLLVMKRGEMKPDPQA